MWSPWGKHSYEEVPTNRLQKKVNHVNGNEAYNLGGFGFDSYFDFSSRPDGHSTEQEKHVSGEVQGRGGYAIKVDRQEAETRELEDTELEDGNSLVFLVSVDVENNKKHGERVKVDEQQSGAREPEETELEDAIELLETPSHLLVSVDMHNDEKDETSSVIVTPTATDVSSGFLMDTNSTAKSEGERDTIDQNMKNNRHTLDSLNDESSRSSRGFGRFRAGTTISSKSGGERDTIDKYIKKNRDTSVLPTDESSCASSRSRFRRLRGTTIKKNRDTSVSPNGPRAAISRGERNTIGQYIKKNLGTSFSLDDESSGSRSVRFRRFTSFPNTLKNNANPTAPAVSGDCSNGAAITAKIHEEERDANSHCKKNRALSDLPNDETSCGSRKGARIKPVSSFSRSLKSDAKPPAPDVSDDWFMNNAINAKSGDKQRDKIKHYGKNRDSSESFKGESFRSSTTNHISNLSRNLKSDVKPSLYDASDDCLRNTTIAANMGDKRDKNDQRENNRNAPDSKFSEHLKTSSPDIKSTQTQNPEKREDDCSRGARAVSNSLDVSKNDGNDQCRVNNVNAHIVQEIEPKCLGEDSELHVDVEVASGFNDDVSTLAETISTIGERLYKYGPSTHMDSSWYEKINLPDSNLIRSDRLAERRQSLAEWRNKLFDMACQEDMKLQEVMESTHLIASKNQISQSQYNETLSPTSGETGHEVPQNAIGSLPIADGSTSQRSKEEGSCVTSAKQDTPSIKSTKQAEPSVGGARQQEPSLNNTKRGDLSDVSKASQGVDDTDVTVNKPLCASTENAIKSSDPSSRKVLFGDLNMALESDKKRGVANQNMMLSSDCAISTMAACRTFSTTEQKKGISGVDSLSRSAKKIDTQSKTEQVDTRSVMDEDSPRDNIVANVEVPLTEVGNDREKEVSTDIKDNYQQEKAMHVRQEHQHEKEALSQLVQQLGKYKVLQNVYAQFTNLTSL